MEDVLRSIDGVRSSAKKLRGCILQSELPSFLRCVIALFMQKSINARFRQHPLETAKLDFRPEELASN
ncbi:MAG: hypothetical protein WCF17_15215 [Terracidiphilus sp.]